MRNEEELREAVLKGAQTLDSFFSDKNPLWWQTIDLDDLDMASSMRCILGQLFDGFGSGVLTLGLMADCEEAKELGFMARHEGYYAEAQLLTELWTDYLNDRSFKWGSDRDLSWARQYVRNGAKVMDEKFPLWYTEEHTDPDEEPMMLLASIRLQGSGRGIPVYASESNLTWSITHGFESGNNASELQLAIAWKEEIWKRRRENVPTESGIDVQFSATVDEEDRKLYIVLNGPFSVGIITEDEEKATTWMDALTSTGQECALIERKI